MTAPPTRSWPLLSVEALVALVCGYFVLVCNGPFWGAVRTADGSLRVLLALGFAAFALHAMVFGLVAWGRLAKPLLMLLLLLTAPMNWYMQHYAVVFDTEMIRNVLQTDLAESRELVTTGLLLHILWMGVLPACLVACVRLRKRPLRRALLLRLGFVLGMLLLAIGALAAGAQGGFSLIRNDPALRYRLTPGNAIVSLARALTQAGQTAELPRQPIATDARRLPAAQARKPRLLVVVVGETVRGDHWGLNGYARQTTPQLARRDVLNFPEVSACGTSTAVSLPCMFSMYGRADYDRAAIRSHQSVLDVAKRAGVAVRWRDNQAGCKGVCDGVAFQTMGPADAPDLCADGRCMDEILLAGLQAQLDAVKGDQLVVLHMLGNHGPNYFERYPPAFTHWKPVCQTAELSRCSRQQIVNAYDNAILYTDSVLARLLDMLAQQPGRDAALLYVSDHGESLGEYGLFLHGAPYAMAPRQQLHVPMVLWLSPGLRASAGLEAACLQRMAARPASHDNLFHTILGMFQIHTKVYLQDRDLLAGCRAH